MTLLNGTTGNKMSILIATARPDCFARVKNALASSGLDLVRLDSLDDLPNMHRGRDPDLILLDGWIDGKDGQRSAEILRTNPRCKSIPIVFIISGQIDIPQIFTGHDRGTVDYLLEPILPSILQAKVAIFKELRDLRLQLEAQRGELDDKNLEIEVLQKELEEKNRREEEFSSLDGLTGLFNRHYFDDNLQKEWRQATRTHAQLSLLLIEIDRVTGPAGQPEISARDDWRCRIAQGLYEALLRPVDIIARYRTDVFAAILPGTGRQGVESVAMRMKANVGGLAPPQEGAVALSMGATTLLPSSGLPAAALYEYAEKALRESKSCGGNVLRICTPDIT